MSLVLDASVTMTWCFNDEQTPATDAILRRLDSERAVVPQHWPIEVANVLLVAERRNRLTPAQTLDFVQLLHTLNIEIDAPSGLQVVENWLAFGRAYQLSSYDAAYLYLAARLGLPLATQDQRLRAAAINAGVPLVLSP